MDNSGGGSCTVVRDVGGAVVFLLLGFLAGCGGGDSEGAPSATDQPASEAASEDAGAAAGAEEPPPSSGIPEGGLEQWVEDIRGELDAIASGDLSGARSQVLNLYVGRQEYIEMFYGPGGQFTGRDHPELARAVTAQETLFHDLMELTAREKPDPVAVGAKLDELRAQLDRVMSLAGEAGVPLERGQGGEGADASDAPEALLGSEGDPGSDGGTRASMPEIRAIVAELDEAEAAYLDGDRETALAGVEHAYLEGFEPLESRLPQANVQSVERLIHLSLRPRIARAAPSAQVSESFDAVRSELRRADVAVASAGSTFWFGAINSLAIILREGLEAVLLVGALLAYLGTMEGGREQRSRIWAGVGLGVVASFATWFVARTLIPVSGGSRELLEGITALVAVAVLIYVSNWIFRRSYLHHWQDFLKDRLDTAISTGSALAMAGLAFAAVYREGFETVLFYQALMFDVGPGPVMAGFVPGLILILGVGWGIIKLGLRLPLKQVFAATNAILIYLAVVFTGKGLYNLQEAGLFAPHPLAWVPDSEALRLGLGVYPVAETLIGQAVLVALVGATFVWYRQQIRVKKTVSEETEEAAEARAPGPAVTGGRPQQKAGAN